MPLRPARPVIAAALAASAALAAGAAPAPARADTYCSRDVHLGQRGAPCARKLANRADWAGFRFRAGAGRALVLLPRGAVFFHCTGRSEAIAFAHHQRNRDACRMIDRTLGRMALGRHGRFRPGALRAPRPAYRHEGPAIAAPR
jgi:hypothetical protein